MPEQCINVATIPQPISVSHMILLFDDTIILHMFQSVFYLSCANAGKILFDTKMIGFNHCKFQFYCVPFVEVFLCIIIPCFKGRAKESKHTGCSL